MILVTGASGKTGRAAIRALAARGTPVRGLVRMFDYYGRYGFSGSSHVLGWLPGREPGMFAAFVWRTVQEHGVKVQEG